MSGNAHDRRKVRRRRPRRYFGHRAILLIDGHPLINGVIDDAGYILGCDYGYHTDFFAPVVLGRWTPPEEK